MGCVPVPGKRRAALKVAKIAVVPDRSGKRIASSGIEAGEVLEGKFVLDPALFLCPLGCSKVELTPRPISHVPLFHGCSGTQVSSPYPMTAMTA